MKQSAVHEVVTSELESTRLEGFTEIHCQGLREPSHPGEELGPWLAGAGAIKGGKQRAK